MAGGVVREPATTPSRRVSSLERELRQGHKGAVVWLTGLSGSGKTTVARGLERRLFDGGYYACVLDGDEFRSGLSVDLGFSPAERTESVRRIAEVAKLFAERAWVVVASAISPYRADRHRARQLICSERTGVLFLEVHVDAPLTICEQRDPKGLYARARAGRLPGFTGISAPYERPECPDLTLRTDRSSVDECVNRLLAQVVAFVPLSFSPHGVRR